MRTFIFILFLIHLGGCEQHPRLLNRLPENGIILAFGDSLTYGTGASLHHNYPSILSQLTGRRVINAGVPGEISQAGLNRLPALLDKHQPDLLILIHGGNDFIRRLPAQQTADHIKQMISMAKQRDIDVVLLGVPRPGLFLMRSAGFYQQLSESLQIATDLETLPKILGSPSLKSDMIHPNDQGYRIMAEHIFQLLHKHDAL